MEVSPGVSQTLQKHLHREQSSHRHLLSKDAQTSLRLRLSAGISGPRREKTFRLNKGQLRITSFFCKKNSETGRLCGRA